MIFGKRLGTMWIMESQIHSVAVQAGGFLMTPLVWATMAASFLALITGLVERVVVFIEDVRAARIRGSFSPRRRTASRPSRNCDSLPRVPSRVGRCRHPRPFEKACLRPPWPKRRRDAQKPQRLRPGAAVLKGSTDRDVDRDTRLQYGYFFPALVAAPNLPPAGQDISELAHRGMDGRPVHLARRDRGMDCVAGRALHQVPDLRTGRGLVIGGLRKRAGPHGRSSVLSSTA